LQLHGLGTITVELTLDDKNITKEELAKIQETVKLSGDKIKNMYTSWTKEGKKDIKNIPEFVNILKESQLFEAILLKWNGNDPTHNEHWGILSKDADFMDELMRGLFTAFDVDGDGTVSFQELLQGTSALLEGNTDEVLRLRFKSIDTDHSGFVDLKEAQSLGGKTQRLIRVGFMVGINAQKYELMKAGLKESDFTPLLEAIDKSFRDNKYAEKEAKLLFKYCDKNEDGKISEDEYVQFMQDDAAIAARKRELDLIMVPIHSAIQVNVKNAMVSIIKRLMG